MPETATIIFPHQLFHLPEALESSDLFVMVEDHLYFRQYPFHKHKLILHRASMQIRKEEWEEAGRSVRYFEAMQQDGLEVVLANLASDGISKIVVCDPEDDYLERNLRKAAESNGLELKMHPGPNFVTSHEDFDEMLDDRGNYFMHTFYQQQRKRMNLLVDEEGQPEGGKWSYDQENRKKLPRKLEVPQPTFPEHGKVVKAAREWVEKHFPDNPGSGEEFIWAVSRKHALDMLDDFLQNRMKLFGPYEDAMAEEEDFVFHFLLTPALNIGLLNPKEVMDKLMEAHAKADFDLPSLEGFVRQVIGWREFMRGVYRREGRKQRTMNHWGFTRKIPASFWDGTTGIPPVDTVIRRVLRTGYCHHIERLMVLGNFMLLCEFDPDEVYEWFMALFVDAYDWVMVPNVYGMSQYADGGLITTKPYLSSSNYIRKMSDFSKGDWCEIWDGLYWRFIHVHREELEGNFRMSMMLRLAEKMDKEKMNKHLDVAESWLESL